jgi:8-oxo-dGTP diphosphatase
MPPADRPVVAALLQPDRYLVTPVPEDDDDGWLAGLSAALARGIRRVQLRAPGCDAQRWDRLATEAAARCVEAGAEVLVNGDVALAERLGAGVHLRATQLAAVGMEARLASLKAKGLAVAASCHEVADLRRAQAVGCDFVVLGPVMPTLSHAGAEGIGWEAFAAMREQVSLPIYALGGMDVEDIPPARAHGAQGIAAIRGLWG